MDVEEYFTLNSRSPWDDIQGAGEGGKSLGT
jgi:hypothetical protein